MQGMIDIIDTKIAKDEKEQPGQGADSGGNMGQTDSTQMGGTVSGN